MSKKLLINTIPLLSPLTGVGRYVFEICSQMSQNNDFEKTFYYGFYSKKIQNLSGNKVSFKANSYFLQSKFLRKLAKKVLFASSRFFPKNFDIYWEPNFIPLTQLKSKYIVTSLHDFSFKHCRNFLPEDRKKYFDNYFDERIIKSDVLICFSEYVKNEISEILDFDDNKVKVIPHGVRHDLFKIYNDAELDFALPNKFILFVGSIEPRKNLTRFLEAYGSLDKTIKDEYKLVLAGFKGWKNREIMELINRNAHYIKYLGYLNDTDLAKVYNKASLFVFPSLYEGFGLPVLEAMACGTPVITSDCSSLPEVGGDAAIYCNPYSVEDIVCKIDDILRNDRLRETLKKKGLDRAKKFTWEESAMKHMEIFNFLTL